jgi:hypothetical protein
MSPAGFGSYAAWIVGGLLIAGGLAVAFRLVYRKYRKRQAWAMIKAEREDNKSRFTRTADSFATVSQQLVTNSAVLEPLRTRIDIPRESLAGHVAWNCDLPVFSDTAWQTIRRSGLTTLMQPHELREVEELYADLDVLQASMANLHREIDAGSHHARVESSESGSQWLADEIELMQAIRIAHEKFGADIRHFHQQHTDFVPSV